MRGNCVRQGTKKASLSSLQEKFPFLKGRLSRRNFLLSIDSLLGRVRGGELLSGRGRKEREGSNQNINLNKIQLAGGEKMVLSMKGEVWGNTIRKTPCPREFDRKNASSSIS